MDATGQRQLLAVAINTTYRRALIVRVHANYLPNSETRVPAHRSPW